MAPRSDDRASGGTRGRTGKRSSLSNAFRCSSSGEAKPYSVAFTVGFLPRMNTSHFASRWAQIAERDRVRKAVRSLMLVHKAPPAPLERARVELVRCSAGPEPDYDNLVATGKHIFDALVRCGVLADDAPKHCERAYSWERAKRGEGCVRVSVHELH